jgi:SAM-dependent methyltransferase
MSFHIFSLDGAGSIWRRAAAAVRAYERSQFGHPRGLIGSLVGRIMAIENRTRNTWALTLLDVQPGDRVLELGFGPGMAIERLACTTAASAIAGIDHSATMVRQARRRNAAAIATGRIDLQLGSFDTLPFPEGSFDRVLAVNALHFTSDLASGLSSVHRVLQPGGRLVIVIQPVWLKGEDAVRQLGEELVAQVTAAGFINSRCVYQPMRPITAIGVLAER